MMNLIRLLAILLLCTIFCPLYAEDSQTKRTIHVEQAGTLPNLISESEKYTIEELTLTGELNGTDFRLLRDMAGSNYLGEITEGKLTTLDLTNAKVVAGGEKYLDTNIIRGRNGGSWSGGTGWHYNILQDNVFPQYVFCLCDLRIINLPNSIANVGERSLSYCRSLTSITIPNSVINIGRNAFENCSGLTNITIPNSVSSIGSQTFYGCSGLTSIAIPNSVTSIGSGVFTGCSGLTSITVASGNQAYDSRDNCNAIIETKSNTLIAGCKNSIIPNSVTSIGSSAFSNCSGLMSITIPNSVTSIGSSAFSNCDDLTSIAIPNSVTSIGSSAFSNCSGLMSITIPNSVTSIGSSAFSGCIGLTSINIPNSLTSIGNSVFASCFVLTSITIPNSVTSIGSYAFANCYGLTSFTIPNSVTSIGDRAFSDCRKLLTVYSEIENPFEITEDVFTNYSKLTLMVPSGCKSAYKSTNYWNKFCQIIEESEIIPKRTIHVEQAGTLPNLIQADEKYRIEELTLTGELNGTDFRLIRDMAGCNYLGDETAGMLTTLDLSNTKIVKGGEKYLDTDHMPSLSGNFRYTIEQDDVLPQFVFACCRLTSVSIPNSVTKIRYYAFEDCSGLTNITIPNSVTTIEYLAFLGCTGLTNITIPKSVTRIEFGIFAGCIGVNSIKVASDNTYYDSRDNCNAIIETKSNTIVAGCVNTIIPNTVTSIGYYAFCGCKGLLSITIPNSVTSIGVRAFESCKGLTSIIIPNSVTTIGNYAFLSCSGLANITIPNSVTTIGNYVFENCYGLTNITIPNSVTSIGTSPFQYCHNLTCINVDSNNSVYDSRDNCNAIIETKSNTLVVGCNNSVIPNSVTSIGSYAFRGCTGLSSITIPNSITSIVEGAFYWCTSLKNVKSKIRNPFKIGTDVFSYLPTDAELIVPYGTKSRYETTEGWNVFSKISEDALQSYNLTMKTDGHGSIVYEGKSYRDQSQNVTVMEGSTVVLTISPDAGYSLANIKVNNVDVTGQVSDNKYTISDFGGDTEVEATFIINSRTIHVATAGTLPNLISESEKYNIVELTLTGELNGTDFRLLRDMAGCNYLGERTEGKLTTLDLTNAKIVKGGEKYLDTDRLSEWGGSHRYTIEQDDILPQFVFACCKFNYIANPNSVTSIGIGAFYSCINLTNNTIPNSVTSIGNSAFSHCINLTNITIPNSVTSIGIGAFKSCPEISSIIVASDNQAYDSRNNCNAIIETKSNTLIAGCKNSVISNTVTSIGEDAFLGCSGLTSITIPNSVSYIGELAFYGCSGLTSITIPNSVTSIGNYAFEFCSGLTSVTISSSVTSIKHATFAYCSGLTHVTIPNSVTSIGHYAFSQCGLTSIGIPNSVTSIESSALEKCNNLISIEVASENPYFDSRNNCNAIIETKSNTLIIGCKKSVIPNSVTSIGSFAFNDCSGLMSITIPHSVTSIGRYAFTECSGLTSVTIPNSVTSIGGYAFSECTGLTSVTIPNSVTSIGDYAFYYCRALKSVKSKIRNPFKIEANVFRDLPTDAELTITNGTKNRYEAAEGWNIFSKTTEEELADGIVFVGKIADNKELAFMIISNNGKTCQVGDGIDCAITNWAEEKIVIPDVVNGYTVKAIGSNAFQNCSTLKSVTIPNTVASIGDGAFQGCSGLTSIISKIENPFAINENVFPQEAYSATLYVPLGTKNQYLATAGWKKFKEIIEIATKNGVVFTDDVNGVTVSFKVTDVDNLKCQFGSGEESAISQSVTSFSIPSEAKGLTVASIADNAIANCASLLSVTFPETIETVGSNVLAGCSNLAVIKWNAERAVPDALTSGVNNPNLLLYVKDKSYAPASVKNVVANGTADEIVLKETDGGNNFYCPETFTAKRISFVHNYSMESGYKECRGWETIVLPFDVTSIMSETGSYIVPRSTWTNEDSQHKPFFLYEWTTAGWQPATAIKANIPYIICMPNNENYDPIYQLKGDFEFTGTNVQVFSTDEIGTVVYRNKRFVPNYLNKEASQSMLPLNVNNLWDKNTKADYTEGSAFLRGLRAVRPFEAYMMMEEGMAAPMAIPVFGDGTPTGIDVLLVNSEGVNNEKWYSLDGRKLQGKPTTKGVYILNGRKVVVK